MDLQILIAEDDALLRKALYDRMTAWGLSVQARETMAEAEAAFAENPADLVLTDMRLPDGDGLELLQRVREARAGTEVVIMTAYADVSTAVAALKAGAYDYLPKPFDDAQLEKIIRNVDEKRRLGQQVSSLAKLATSELDEVAQFGDMIGTAVLGRIFSIARRIAKAPDTTVLILGESGTGKGMLAKAIHRTSPRASKPFVDINCSAIPAQLMESELFGYEKGAFTDAKSRKDGLLEIAHGGTVFLDEIGDMELNLQGKILKVLEDKEFRRLGGAKSVKVDVRIVAATNRDLQAMAKEGKFREDLYYRLSVVPIRMPPLREHAQSIELLLRGYLNFYNRQTGRKIKDFTPEAMAQLQRYAWPGNVRELRNVVERCVILSQSDMIGVEDIGPMQGEPHAHTLGVASAAPVAAAPVVEPRGESVEPAVVPPAAASAAVAPSAAAVEGDTIPIMSLADAEQRLIRKVMESVGGNKNKAAEILQIHRTTLYKKIEEYKIG